MITLISTPEYHPGEYDACRWVATESPNNFRLLRRDWTCGTPVNNGGYLQVTVDEDYTGEEGNTVAIYNAYTEEVLVGEITNIDVGLRDLTTDIPFVATIDPEYLNDNTLHGGYYFEGRVTINDVLYPITIIASPDSKGYADLDVSGILRIVTSLGKTGDYTLLIAREPTKSGKFNFEYRECWYGSDNDWEGVAITSPIASPPILIDWYYGECVRSEEQGSNLHEFVMNEVDDAPFLNMFEQPVFYPGLPWDISFILPELAEVSPTYDITVTIKIYNSVNTQLIPDIIRTIEADALEGYINSLWVDPDIIPGTAHHMTIEIEV